MAYLPTNLAKFYSNFLKLITDYFNTEFTAATQGKKKKVIVKKCSAARQRFFLGCNSQGFYYFFNSVNLAKLYMNLHNN